MKYICKNCDTLFDEPIENKNIKSWFVRLHILKCTECNSNDIGLSEHGKLLVERKAKINRIENKKICE